MLRIAGVASIAKIRAALKMARKWSVLVIPIAIDNGPAIASPTGRSNIVPMASNDDTRDSASRGTSLAIAVDQIVVHKSMVIPQSNAQKAINQIDCGFAIDHM